MSLKGKPHLGNLLVDKGLAPDMISAIRQYINPCKSDSDRLDAAKVISAVTESGGIPVWAHPLGGTGEKKLTMADNNIFISLLFNVVFRRRKTVHEGHLKWILNTDDHTCLKEKLKDIRLKQKFSIKPA